MGCSLVELDCHVASLLAETVRGAYWWDCRVASLLAETVRGSVLVGLPRRFASRRDES